MSTSTPDIVAAGLMAFPTPSQIRDALLRAIAFAFLKQGLVANVGIGSDHYIRATAYASRVSIALANNKISQAATNPLTAQGQDCVDLAAVFGVEPRPASPAVGPVIIKVVGGAPVTVPAAYQGQAPTGQLYQSIAVTTAGNNGTVEVVAQSPGTAGNLGAGAQFVWTSASIGALSIQATVGPGGLEGGVDSDVTTNADGSLNVEKLRARLLFKLANPGTGGNSALVVEWAEEATAAVEAAYASAAARGPGSYDVAVTKAGGDRSLPAATLGVVAAYVAGKMPGSQDLNVTSVTPQRVDTVIGATLPLPQSSGGAGNGWLDGIPYPAEDTKVTAYNTGTGKATFNSTASPAIGNHIALWDPDATDANNNPAPALLHYVVQTVTGSAGAWVVGVQGGFMKDPTLGATTTPYVSADAVRLDAYAAELLAQFNALGPGEKTANPLILKFARRFPGTDVQAANTLSNRMLSAVMQKRTADANATLVYPEIADLEFTLRVATGTSTPLVEPSVPNTTADPPNILTLRHLAIRKF